MCYVTLLAEAIRAERPAAVARIVGGQGFGQSLLVGLDGPLVSNITDPVLAAEAAVLAMAMLSRGETGTHWLRSPDGSARIYVESHLPPPILLVIGAGHVGQRVAEAGALADFQVVVLDDRSAYANAERFPNAHRVICGPFVPELQALQPGPRHHVVLMTRGHAQDRTCLQALLGRPVAYMGMIGSRNRVEAVFAQLRAEGADEAWLQRVRAPIGLDIGGRTPGEIAIAVLAEVIAARRGGTGAPLSSLGRQLIHANRR